ncbi:MAG: 3-methyl-2-oxobutanoate hydroxymethyltransferase [Endomicrobiales bacterium]|nr:3-methyl-2-oxobutanoate hydroxymethyltransferase [Endomicrobiales bacterium]
MKTKITIKTLAELKKAKRKITALTAYDYPTAKILDDAGVDVVLVGDSVGMVKLGYPSTIPVELFEIIYHCRAVRRAVINALLVADMPFMSYETSKKDAIKNAGEIIKYGMAQAVKIEGGEELIDNIKAVIDAKIPVMGHLGLMPQAINLIGGYKIQGKTDEDAEKIIRSAHILEKAGVFAVVLECVPEKLAKTITSELSIPTIGIGSGKYCDGQILVSDDMFGITQGKTPGFVKRYANLSDAMIKATKLYCQEVKQSKFPK